LHEKFFYAFASIEKLNQIVRVCSGAAAAARVGGESSKLLQRRASEMKRRRSRMEKFTRF